MKIVQTSNGPRRQFSAKEINAMPKSARPIHCEELNPAEMAKKYADRVRHGKTRKDRNRRTV